MCSSQHICNIRRGPTCGLLDQLQSNTRIYLRDDPEPAQNQTLCQEDMDEERCKRWHQCMCRNPKTKQGIYSWTPKEITLTKRAIACHSERCLLGDRETHSGAKHVGRAIWPKSQTLQESHVARGSKHVGITIWTKGAQHVRRFHSERIALPGDEVPDFCL